MPRETKEQKAAKAVAAREAEAADRARTESELATIAAFEQEHDRPPTKDELAERRAANATRDADAALEAEMGGHTPGDGDAAAAATGNGNSGSISERAANGAAEGHDDDGDPVFVFEGEQVTLATLLKRVKTIEHAWKFTGKREKGKGALPSLDGDIHLLIRAKPGKYEVVPTRDDQEKTEKVVIETKVDPKVIHDALSEDGQLAMVELLRLKGWTVDRPQPQQAAG